MFVGSRKTDTKTWLHVTSSLKKSLDRVPGGVKMACSSIALAFALWIVIQFGSQSAMMAAIEATSALKMPMETIKSYLNTYSESAQSSRWKRAVRRLPQIDNKELISTVTFSQSLIDKMARHETNIRDSDVFVKFGTPNHGQLVDGMPSFEALDHGKDAAIAVRASQHIANKYCLRLGIDDDSCALQVAQLSLSPTSLGNKCSTHYREAVFCSELSRYRSPDGSCNHPSHASWGQAITAYARLIPAQYEDGFHKPRGSVFGREFPSARLLSTSLSRNIDTPDTTKTLATMQWGQFIAHDMAHTVISKMYNTESPIVCCSENGMKLSPRHVHPSCYPIEVPSKDPFYSQFRHNCMSYVRSMPALRPDCKFGPTEQLNQATHLLDGSMIYGSTQETQEMLRAHWNGRLRSEIRNGKEFLSTAPSSACQSGNNGTCYLAGDVRVNSSPHLAVMHTIWLREHNRVAERLSTLNPHWNDERVFQEARKLVVAEIQHVTYTEWLPIVLGVKYVKRDGLKPLRQGYSHMYNENVNPAVTNSFDTAAMRFTKSLMEERIGLYEEDRNPQLSILLKEHYNQPLLLEGEENLDSLLRGLATQSSQKMDLHYSKAVTSFLYSEAGPFGMDGVSLDIQRGRDHGLAGYNDFREYCGLPRAGSFNELADTIPNSVIGKLRTLYKNVDDVDLLVGGMAERPVEEGLLGPVFRCIVGEQFVRTRAGDKFFYDNANQPGSFTEDQLAEIRKTSLARVFCDNSDILTMQPHVFHKPITPSNDLTACSESKMINRINLQPWFEEPFKSILE